MFKNAANQKLIVFAFDATTGLPKTGDAANITAYVNKDYTGATVLGDTSAAEIDSTNAKGYYLFDLTTGETNADCLNFTGKSSTANIVVVGAPATVYTLPVNFTALSISAGGLVDILQTAADKVWGTVARVLTAGTNIVLAKGTGITGFTDATPAQNATAVWQDTTAGDFTTAGSIGKSLFTSGNAPGAASGLSIVGSAMTLTSAYDPAKTASQAGDAMSLTSGERTTLGGVIWGLATSGLTGVGSIGKLLVDNINATITSRAVAGDAMALTSGERTTLTGVVWAALTSGLNTANSVGKLLVDNLNATITSRMASYTQPANFLTTTFPAGTVASSSEVTSIQNNTRAVIVVPEIIERPDSGSDLYLIHLYLYDEVGNMEAPDSAPTLTLVNSAGTNRAGRLDSATGTLVGTGHYKWEYTNTSTDTLEQLLWEFSVVEGGATRLLGRDSLLVDTTAVDFTAADRIVLQAAATQLSLDALQSDVTDLGSPMQAGATVVLTDGSLTTSKLGAFVLAKTTNITGFNDIAAGTQMDLINAPNATAIGAIGTGVWATTVRVLTAGTNIALTKGTGLLGLNDIAATAVVSNGAITTLAGAVVNLGAAYDAAKTASSQTSVDDLPTNAELSTALTALQTHGDSTWSTATGFSTFDPDTDTVARVTLVDTFTSNADVTSILKLLQADQFIDNATTPWAHVLIESGTGGVGVGTELKRKRLKTVTGSNITSTEQVVGQEVQ